jgi:ubiquinone/menaquinone biosynthesis C-methylase UbiE
LQMKERIKGSELARRFYDKKGWTVEDGQTVDRKLFGVRENGPIRIELHSLFRARLRAALSQAGTELNLLECGCGGQPEKNILDLCSRYTGVDFSLTGLQTARSTLSDSSVPARFLNADVCALPFASDSFDAVYCAHMIYHIDSVEAQDAALTELMRVVRPGGILVLVTANPRPLLFPLRLAKRVVADTPVLGRFINRVRPKPSLPYQPMTIGRTKKKLAESGKVRIVAGSIPSTYFSQHSTEYAGFGKQAWRAIRWLTVNKPVLSAYLGNYVTMACYKQPQ